MNCLSIFPAASSGRGKKTEEKEKGEEGGKWACPRVVLFSKTRQKEGHIASLGKQEGEGRYADSLYSSTLRQLKEGGGAVYHLFDRQEREGGKRKEGRKKEREKGPPVSRRRTFCARVCGKRRAARTSL